MYDRGAMRLRTITGRRCGKLMAVAVPLLALAGGGAWIATSEWRKELITYSVRPDRLELIIEEQGTVEPIQTQPVVSRVRARSRPGGQAANLKWIITDGTPVKRGDVVAELDCGLLQDELRERLVLRAQAENEWSQAEQDSKLAGVAAQAAVDEAEMALQLAELDLEAFREGEYARKLKDLKSQILLARVEIDGWRDRLAWSNRMFRLGFQAALQHASERSGLDLAQANLIRLEEELKVLTTYERKRTELELSSKVDQSRRAVALARDIGRAKASQAEVYRLSRKRVFVRRDRICRDLQAQIEACTLRAPCDGIAVHPQPELARGPQRPIVAQGEPVYEGQTILLISDVSRFHVKTWIHESDLAHVDGDSFPQNQSATLGDQSASWDLFGTMQSLGFPHEPVDSHDWESVKSTRGDSVLVRVNAFPDRVFHGRIKQIGALPSWRDIIMSNSKLYPATVEIGEDPAGLKQGMTAEVSILASQPLENILTVPAEAVIGSLKRGSTSRVFVLTADGPQDREIEVGFNNDAKVQVCKGLVAGEEVVLNPVTLLNKHTSGSGPGQ